MTRKQFDARMVAWSNAIDVLNDFECDPDDDNAEEEMKQCKILAAQFEKQCRRWLGSVKRSPTNPAQTAKEPCPICGGTGVNTDLIEQCFACKGTRVATPAQTAKEGES